MLPALLSGLSSWCDDSVTTGLVGSSITYWSQRGSQYWNPILKSLGNSQSNSSMPQPLCWAARQYQPGAEQSTIGRQFLPAGMVSGQSGCTVSPGGNDFTKTLASTVALILVVSQCFDFVPESFGSLISSWVSAIGFFHFLEHPLNPSI